MSTSTTYFADFVNSETNESIIELSLSGTTKELTNQLLDIYGLELSAAQIRNTAKNGNHYTTPGIAGMAREMGLDVQHITIYFTKETDLQWV